MVSPIVAFAIANKEVILSAIVLPYVYFTLSKFPDPRKYVGKWYYPHYYAFFQLATHYSSGEWNKWGVGKVSPPFVQSPPLETVPVPNNITFDRPKFYAIETGNDNDETGLFASVRSWLRAFR